MNLGFVGVGRMGANMARRLKERQFHITAVYDTNRATATSLAAELGCAAAQDLSEVTAGYDVIFTVVTDDSAMRNIFSGSGDNLLINARGKLFINCATVSPQVHIEIEKLAQQAGAETLEACMASSIPQAREGRLYLMCGGTVDAFDGVPGTGRQLFGHHEPLDFAGGSQFCVQRSFIEFGPEAATRLGNGDHDKTGIAKDDGNDYS